MQHTWTVQSDYMHVTNYQEAWFRHRLWRRGNVSVKGLKGKYSWRNPLVPILQVFNLMGRMPFYRDKTDATLKFKFFSVPMAWAFVSNCAQIIFVAKIFYYKVSHMKYWKTFDGTLMSFNELIVLTSCFHGLTATWAATPAVARAVNRWEAYHATFYTVSGRRISSNFLNNNYIGLLVMVIPSSAIFVQHLFAGQVVSLFHVTKEVVYIISVYYIYLVLWLWIVLCSLVIKSADLLKVNFIESTASLPTPEVISLHRALWLELNACAGQLSSALASTFQSWNVNLFSSAVLATYGIIVSVNNSNYDLIITLVIIVSSINTIAFVTYTFGYFTQQSLELLLDSIEMGKPCFETRGLYVIDRRTHVRMIELLLTYLVIVVQLKEQTAA